MSEIVIVNLRNEDWCDGFVQGRPVHVDRRSDGQNEPGHSRVDLVLRLQRFNRY